MCYLYINDVDVRYHILNLWPIGVPLKTAAVNISLSVLTSSHLFVQNCYFFSSF